MYKAKRGLTDMQNAARRLKNVLQKTDVIQSTVFSHESHNKVYLKPENLQETGSFKIRGAYNKISLLSKKEQKKGLIASSAGNHAQGVALAAKKARVPATVVMPKTAPLSKIKATERHGAKVILAGDNYDEAYKYALQLQKKKHATFVHPFDDWDVIAGQGTIALEILDQLPNADVIVAPIGGGGLISGIAIAAKAINPKIKIIGVEAEGADATVQSLKKKHVVELKTTSTIADGIALKKPGKTTFDVIRHLVDDVVTVTDVEIMEAVLLLLERHKLVAEPAGAATLAALLHDKVKMKGKKIVAIVSGGNIDVTTMSTLIERGLVERGRIFGFTVNLPDRPGELLKVAKILADQNANVIELEHNQFKTTDRLLNVQLDVTVETNGHEHVKRIINALKKRGYKIVKQR